MKRHRQADIADATWLAQTIESRLPEGFRVHGQPWRDRRDLEQPDDGILANIVPNLPGYKTWIVGMYIFASAALAIGIGGTIWPGLFT
jgi:hypothetical protein